MFAYGYAPHFPRGLGVARSNCPMGKQGEDGRTMRAITKAGWSDFKE
jgi:hypothetical protein